LEDGLAAKKTAAEDAKKEYDDAKTAFDDFEGTEEEKEALQKTMDEKMGGFMEKERLFKDDEAEMAPLK